MNISNEMVIQMSKGPGTGVVIMIALVLLMTLAISIYLIHASIVGLADIIWFFPLTCLLPLLLMILVSWVLKIGRVLSGTQRN